jgi:phage terminase small subunit
MPSNELNARQQCFVKEYLIDLNATQAAIRAGYSEHTAGQIGEQNLKKLGIKRAIESALSERATKTERKAADVLADIQGLAQEAKSNYLKDPSNTAMLNGALKALELEGKHLGMGGKVEINGGITSIVRTIVDPPIDFVNCPSL